MIDFPALVGVIHLPPLPGSPRFGGDLDAVVARAASDAMALRDAGFDAMMLENFGDAPFVPERVAPVTVACMARCALAARDAAPGLPMGINVLRNDAEAALSVAVGVGAAFIRVNVHVGARVTDQGLIGGRAHETLRLRRALGAESVRLFCDVDVKHSAPLAPRALTDETEELVGRGLADAVLITGAGTGKSVGVAELDLVADAADVPVYVASGATPDDLSRLERAFGLVVGSALRASGRAGDPIDLGRARAFVEAFRRARG
jgi:membrane complex biogenesis BtpA family protein